MMTFVWYPGMTLGHIEKIAILQALSFYHGNKTLTAKSIGCAYNTLINKLEQYEVDDAKLIEDEKKRDADEKAFDLRQRGQSARPAIETLESDIRAGIRSAIAGVRVESTPVPSAPAPMPVREHAEAHVMLPRESSSGGSRKRGA